MASLLPPVVTGPVSVLDLLVHVSGALAGATVDLLVNGTKPPANAVVDGSGNASIPISIGLLNIGDQVTALQSSGADTSDPSQNPVVVMGVPSQLPPLAYLRHNVKIT